MILKHCTQFKRITVHHRERKSGGWGKTRNGWSKSFALTSPHHSQSLCDCADWLPVKSILAVNTSVVLSIFHVATDIDRCQQDRFWYEQGRGIQSGRAIVKNKSVGVSQGKGNVLCTIPDQNTCHYNASNSAGLYGWDVIYHAQLRLTTLHR